jgi:hypothetical protein
MPSKTGEVDRLKNQKRAEQQRKRRAKVMGLAIGLLLVLDINLLSTSHPLLHPLMSQFSSPYCLNP